MIHHASTITMRGSESKVRRAVLLSHQELQPTMEKVHSEILDAFHRLHQKGDRPTDEDAGESCNTTLLAVGPTQPLHTQMSGSGGGLDPKRELDVSLNLGTGSSSDVSGATSPSNRPRFSKAQRRLSEAALFFDTVGEVPPASRSEWENLIADDDDESEDLYSDSGSAAEEAAEVQCRLDAGPSCKENAGAEFALLVDAPPEPVLSDVSEPSSPSGSPPRQRRRSESLPNPFLHRLPPMEKSGSCDSFHYKGLHVYPPAVVYRGTSRGNFSSLHRKAWLESADPMHRYGKNLRMYYRHWESLGFPSDVFFDWLDAKGGADGEALPELAECPRPLLDEDRVEYITDMDVTRTYALSVVPDELGRGVIMTAKHERVRTGPDGWIFVLRDDVLYGARKVARMTGGGNEAIRRFHHSSFFGGKAVAAAGIFVTDDNGVLKQAFPHSGHYRPGEAEVQRMLYFFFSAGVDLKTFDVDIQQIIHLARHNVGDKVATIDAKEKKRNSLYMRPATAVADYLCHKARLIGLGIFSQIHLHRDPCTPTTDSTNCGC